MTHCDVIWCNYACCNGILCDEMQCDGMCNLMWDAMQYYGMSGNKMQAIEMDYNIL